jgi:GNAT superfamily N-acetyltransferase
LIFKEVDINSLHLFKSIIPIIFKNYRNHYFSNPYLDKSEILEGYVEWASAYVTEIDTSKKSWLVYKDDILIGFATCSMNKIDNSCEGVLYGVHPEYSGGGIYTDIIRFTQAYFKEHNYEKMFVSTQIQNYTVQKVWQKESFLINNAYYTYHLMKKHL